MSMDTAIQSDELCTHRLLAFFLHAFLDGKNSTEGYINTCQVFWSLILWIFFSNKLSGKTILTSTGAKREKGADPCSLGGPWIITWGSEMVTFYNTF